MSPGDEVVLLDDSGMEYTLLLTGFNRGSVQGEIVSTKEGRGEPALKITLYQGMLKGEKFQWVLQKGTEMGVSAFAPVLCHRSIAQDYAGWQKTRYPRWQRIITEAAEQSGRCRLPRLAPPMTFKDACKDACTEVKGPGLSIVPWEQERAVGLRNLLEGVGLEDMVLEGVGPSHVNIFIGPEGGLEDWEVAHASSCGVVPVSLGQRILRSETAAIATVAAVMYAAGGLGQ
jgi:16S rRNA (uracil1498-N3)-methyltransferase